MVLPCGKAMVNKPWQNRGLLTMVYLPWLYHMVKPYPLLGLLTMAYHGCFFVRVVLRVWDDVFNTDNE